MRLINADALDAEMYHKSFEVDDGRNVWNSGLWIRYKIFEEAIRDAPTIDAVPVVHAQWFTSYDGMLHCSNCFETPTNRVMVRAELIYDMTPIREKMHYCPHCGARMDAEKEEK